MVRICRSFWPILFLYHEQTLALWPKHESSVGPSFGMARVPPCEMGLKANRVDWVLLVILVFLYQGVGAGAGSSWLRHFCRSRGRSQNGRKFGAREGARISVRLETEQEPEPDLA